VNSSAAKPDDVDHLLGESLEGEFEITPSIYETARLVSNAPWLDGHASRLQYLCAQQTPDGSWGEPGYHLVPTLSATEAVLATAIAEQGAVNNAVSRDWLVSAATRGLDVLHRQLAPGAPVPLPDTVAIELIIPGLVARINQHLDHAASSARLDLPARFRTAQLQCPDGTSPALLERLRRAAAAGQSLPEKLSHTWEMLAPAGSAAIPMCGSSRVPWPVRPPQQPRGSALRPTRPTPPRAIWPGCIAAEAVPFPWPRRCRSSNARGC